MGIKHNAVAQIFSFQQRDHETVRDCVNRLKQYIARCPEEEKPSQARLISIFLEGLKNRTLYAHLYACKHTTFNACCMDAMDFDDNFDDSSTSSQVMDRERRQSSSDASSSKVQNPDNIVDMVLRRLGQTYRPPYRQTNYAPAPTPTAGPYACGICALPHRTDQCTSYVPGANQPPTRCWCQVCKWNTTHVTKDCGHINRLARERENVFRTQAPNQANYQGNVQHGYTRQEVAKPVLGTQPPPPGTVPVRYVETETQEPSMELALSEPYYQGPEYDWQEPQAEFIDVSNTHQDFNEESNSMMLVGPMPPYSQRSSQQYPPRRSAPSSSGIKCFRCGGDHMVKDCPEPPPPRPRLPPIERYCEGCCVEHFPMDCPSKSLNTPAPGPKTFLNYIRVVPSPYRSEAEADQRSLKVVTRSQSQQPNVDHEE